MAARPHLTSCATPVRRCLLAFGRRLSRPPVRARTTHVLVKPRRLELLTGVCDAVFLGNLLFYSARRRIRHGREGSKEGRAGQQRKRAAAARGAGQPTRGWARPGRSIQGRCERIRYRISGTGQDGHAHSLSEGQKGGLTAQAGGASTDHFFARDPVGSGATYHPGGWTRPAAPLPGSCRV